MNIDPPGFTLAEAGVRLIAVMATVGIPLLSLVMNPIAAGAFLALLFIVMALRYGKPTTWSSPDLQVLLPALVASIAAGYLPIRKLDRHTLEVTILMGFALVVFASGTSVAAQEVIGAEHWVEQAGVRIYVWEKYVESPAAKRVVILAHGSATAGKESFDLQVPGKPSYSLMDTLAREGFDVFALDTRGFGRSTRPEGHMTTREASDDLNAVVEYILKLRGVERVSLLAWSWGTQYSGMFVMSHPSKVERYISYAQMHLDSPDLSRRRARVAAFRKDPYISIPEAGWKSRFTSIAPAEVNDPVVVDAYAREAAQIEPMSPTGPQLDMATLMPMVNARLMPVPTMIIHGQYDDVADLDGLLPFFHQLPNPNKRYIVVPEAGHMMHLQKSHGLFDHEVITFLKAP
jgi:pimeloyl-ACP methyl ester carboxylesterase